MQCDHVLGFKSSRSHFWWRRASVCRSVRSCLSDSRSYRILVVLICPDSERTFISLVEVFSALLLVYTSSKGSLGSFELPDNGIVQSDLNRRGTEADLSRRGRNWKPPLTASTGQFLHQCHSIGFSAWRGSDDDGPSRAAELLDGAWNPKFSTNIVENDWVRGERERSWRVARSVRLSCLTEFQMSTWCGIVWGAVSTKFSR